MSDVLASPTFAAARRLPAWLCALVLALTGAAAAPASAQLVDAWPADAVPGTLLVTLAAPADPLEIAAAARVTASAAPLSDAVVRVRVADGDEAVAAAGMRRHPGVVAVEADHLRTFDRVPDDARYDEQWAHVQANAEAAWDVTTGSPDVLVAVIDSGVRGDHRDLTANIVEQVEAATGDVAVVGAGVDNDGCRIGHGTQVAGVLGAVGNDGREVAGVAWRVGIVDIAVTSERSSCAAVADSAVIAALEYARTRPGGPVDVANLSLGAPGSACPVAYQTEIAAARAAGIVVIASAGNRGQPSEAAAAPAVPASCNGVIAVGATDRGGGRADYSSGNRWLDVLAPGGSAAAAGSCAAAPAMCVLTTTRDGVGAVEGTSYAAPYAAGVAALVRAAAPRLSPAQVEAVLERTARDLGVPGRDDDSGWGALQAGAAVSLAAGGDPIPDPDPDPIFPIARRHAALMPAPGPDIVRIWSGQTPTEPVPQAVAVSQATFVDRGAAHVVLARGDAYPDALTGSTLGLGAGPLLFTAPGDVLDGRTRAEILRTLPPGGRVYLLGGTAALPAALELELVSLGYDVTRVAGSSRLATAAAGAREVVARRVELGVPDPGMAVLVTARDWPDAVSAGALGATLGVPILLTHPDVLDPATGAALAALAPARLYVVGGVSAVSEAAALAARQASGRNAELMRLAGPSRSVTAVAVARELDRLERAAGGPALAVAVNYDREVDGYAHVLSASALLGAYTGVIIPLLGHDGSGMDPATEAYLRGVRRVGVVVGGPDVVADASVAHVAQLLGAGQP